MREGGMTRCKSKIWQQLILAQRLPRFLPLPLTGREERFQHGIIVATRTLRVAVTVFLKNQNPLLSFHSISGRVKAEDMAKTASYKILTMMQYTRSFRIGYSKRKIPATTSAISRSPVPRILSILASLLKRSLPGQTARCKLEYCDSSCNLTGPLPSYVGNAKTWRKCKSTSSRPI